MAAIKPSQSSSGPQRVSPVDAAQKYHARGYAPVPIPPRKKGPETDAWQKLRLTAEQIAEAVSPSGNLGLITGEASGHLVDVDLDCHEAVRLAKVWLPATGMIHGRENNPESHYWYQVEPPAEDAEPLTRDTFKDPQAGEMILEIRGDRHQTMVPPSIHPDDGDVLRWKTFDQPARIHLAQLRTACKKVAAGALLMDRWKKTSRHGAAVGHDATLALAGFLLRRMTLEEVTDFLTTIARVAGGDYQKVARDVRDTAEKLEKKEPVTGGGALREFFDPKVISKIVEWLGLEEEAPDLRVSETPAVAGEIEEPLEFPSPAEFLLTEPRNLVRLRTGLPTLDRATRGGIPTGIITTFLGAPHTGKTALGSQLGVRAAGEGYLVCIVFKDEGRFAGTVRLGQQLGLDRERLENQEAGELQRFTEALRDKRILVPDGDSGSCNLENLIREMEERETHKRLLMVDSLQSVYALCADGKGQTRDELTAKMRLLERFAKRGGLVVVISEMNRSGYRNKDERENAKGMASGAESRSIEYVSRLLIGLEGDAERIITAKIEKNSPGGKRPHIRLKFDPVRAEFREIDEAAAEAEAEQHREEEEARKKADVREKIRRKLAKRVELNARGLEKAVRGDKERFAEVREEMVEEGKLLYRQDGQQKFYRLSDIE